MRRVRVGNTRILVQAYIGCGNAFSMEIEEASRG
jgi:hypothetical protein